MVQFVDFIGEDNVTVFVYFAFHRLSLIRVGLGGKCGKLKPIGATKFPVLTFLF